MGLSHKAKIVPAPTAQPVISRESRKTPREDQPTPDNARIPRPVDTSSQPSIDPASQPGPTPPSDPPLPTSPASSDTLPSDIEFSEDSRDDGPDPGANPRVYPGAGGQGRHYNSTTVPVGDKASLTIERPLDKPGKNIHVHAPAPQGVTKNNDIRVHALHDIQYDNPPSELDLMLEAHGLELPPAKEEKGGLEKLQINVPNNEEKYDPIKLLTEVSTRKEKVGLDKLEVNISNNQENPKHAISKIEHTSMAKKDEPQMVTNKNDMIKINVKDGKKVNDIPEGQDSAFTPDDLIINIPTSAGPTHSAKENGKKVIEIVREVDLSENADHPMYSLQLMKQVDSKLTSI